MANFQKRLPENAEGNFFVDSTCIDCDACRELAPTTFRQEGEFSVVFHQPGTPKEKLKAYQALLACPVGSIGATTADPVLANQAKLSFPICIEKGVYYNGFQSEKSFGANSYLIQHPGSNWLIDSPRYVNHLVAAFKHLGGIRYIFLTHEDDVADAGRYAKTFGATRIIHRHDAGAMPAAEWIVEGDKGMEIVPDWVAIPVPGHTTGSMALLHRNRYLFTGDHLWWDRDQECLDTPSLLIWDEEQLLRSCEKLLDFTFEWILPGHGDRIHLTPQAMKLQLSRLLERRTSRRVVQ